MHLSFGGFKSATCAVSTQTGGRDIPIADIATVATPEYVAILRVSNSVPSAAISSTVNRVFQIANQPTEIRNEE
jgi:hypothetical protein